LVAKPQAQLIGEVSQFRPPLDRAAGGEGDQQAFGARGIARRRLRLQIKLREPLFGGGKALIEPALLFFHPFDRLFGLLSLDRGGKWGGRSGQGCAGSRSGLRRDRSNGARSGEAIRLKVVPYHPADQPPAQHKGEHSGHDDPPPGGRLATAAVR
jgi:hypothetical protein